MKTTPQTSAALLYLLPAAAVCGIWYVLLFAGNEPGFSATKMFMFSVTEGPQPTWFLWLLLLPVACLALAAAYASPLARGRRGSQVLLAAGTALAVCAWFTFTFEVALLASLPLLYGYLGAKQAKTGEGANGA